MSALEISAHEQIRQLACPYAEAVDSRDLARLVALFVEDVQVGRAFAASDRSTLPRLNS
jgi:ketosteroid isomerase-like protein